MNYEEIIGTALLTGDHDKALRRITCKTAAMTRMFCGCGQIHDQKKIHVVEIIHPDKREETIAALCPACYARNESGIATVAKKAAADYIEAKQEPPIVRVATWGKFIIVKGA
tara:strand:+ start:564 stop:899 length:336 start_codon:yes stop_codon:yes gene_type:complete